jgi:ASC-1-like (ASCH) protein
MVHNLKIKKEHLSDLQLGKKNNEIRLNDRCYKLGDYLFFHSQYGWAESLFKITHVLHYTEFPQGLREGYVILSLQEVRILTNKQLKQ